MTPRLRARVRRAAVVEYLRHGWELDPNTQPIDDYVCLLWCRPDDPPWRPIGCRSVGVVE